MDDATATGRPRLRGVLHQWACAASLPTGVLLVLLAPSRRAAVAAGVYGLSLSALFGVSALYHRVTWTPATRRWMRRLDHAMIFLLIAGTFTPVCLLAVGGPLGRALLTVVWGGAIAGIALQVAWIDAPKWVMAAVGVALGWVGVVALPAMVAHAGWPPALLLLAGGLLYSLGAWVYARRRPDPAPAVFGYHEVFHALVVAAAGVHWIAVAGWVVPGA